MLTASVTLTCDAPTLGAVRAFLATADRLGAAAHAQLDAGVLLVVGGNEPLPAGSLAQIRDLEATYAELSDITDASSAESIAITLPVFAVDEIMCGSHIGEQPMNILVQVNPSCNDC
jgi:hypothetical protein